MTVQSLLSFQSEEFHSKKLYNILKYDLKFSVISLKLTGK